MKAPAPEYQDAPESEFPAPQLIAPRTRWRIFGYISIILLLHGFGSPSGGLIGLPLSFFLKNRLHLAAHDMARFLLIASIPRYFAFLFGFIRDSWNPFGLRDRGYLLAFGTLSALLYLIFAAIPPSALVLLTAVLLLATASLFIAAAQTGLGTSLGQQHVMTGQMSALWHIVGALPELVALVAGGLLSDQLEGENATHAAHVLFLAGAAIMTLLALFALWKPAAVYRHWHPEQPAHPRPLADLTRLARHWPAYPALLIWFMWNFAPGSATPLQYYLQNTLHARDAQWGEWNAIFAASFIPTFLLAGHLCRTQPLRRLLWWGTLVAVPQMVPLLFIHSIDGALLAAIPIGLMGGVASVSYLDLLFRSCPHGLQGSVVMMSSGLAIIAVRFGDVLGTNLYDHHGGFGVCVIATTLVYALIFAVLAFVPRRLTNTPDGVIPAP